VWVRQMKLNTQQKHALAESPTLYPKGFPDFPAVGLSFYTDNVNAVRKSLFMNDGDNTLTEAVLVCDPENPYSESGTAVAVFVNELKVGHLPSLSSGIFFDVISTVGGICKVQCNFYYSEEGKSACRLDVAFPPSFSKPSRNPELVKLEGQNTFDFRMRSSKYPINWSSLSERESPLYLEVGDTYFGIGNLIMSEYQRSPYLQTEFAIETAKPYQADERIVNRVLATVGGEALVGFSLTRTSPTSHSTKLDLDLSKWKQAEKAHNEAKKRSERPVAKATTTKPRKSKSVNVNWGQLILGKPTRRKKTTWSSLFFGD
jgi:hypothetical protein